jgi:hypothetical protein
MGDVVNLNRFRKAAKKRDDKAHAAAQRALHGTSGTERARLEAERERARQLLDGHKRDGEAGIGGRPEEEAGPADSDT